MAKLTLTGTVTLAATADRALVDRLLPDHATLTRAEPGCLRFEVTLVPGEPPILQVREVFGDRTAFEAHQSRTRASAWGRATAHLRRDYRIAEAD